MDHGLQDERAPGATRTAGHPTVSLVRELVARAAMFDRFQPADLDALAAGAHAMRLESHPDGHDIVTEGDAAHDLRIIRRGSARVFKRSSRGGEHEVNRLGPGDTIGELALIDPAPRSATVRADGPVEVLAMPIDALLALAEARPTFAAGLLGMARGVVGRLRESTAGVVESLEDALQQERTRIAMGKFVVTLIVAYSLYTWVLGTAAQVKQALGRSELVTLPTIIVISAFLFWFIRTSGYPARFFGFTLRHAGRHAAEALAATVPLMGLVVLLKWWMVDHVPSMLGQPVFQMLTPPPAGQPASVFNPWLLLGYVLFVPFQEAIYRGGLQGALEHFLTGRWRVPLAILASNIIFSAGHLYISPGLSVSAFVAGVFWGWLYSRQRGLVGVSISHIVLGFWAFEVVDLGVLE